MIITITSKLNQPTIVLSNTINYVTIMSDSASINLERAKEVIEKSIQSILLPLESYKPLHM